MWPTRIGISRSSRPSCERLISSTGSIRSLGGDHTSNSQRFTCLRRPRPSASLSLRGIGRWRSEWWLWLWAPDSTTCPLETLPRACAASGRRTICRGLLGLFMDGSGAKRISSAAGRGPLLLASARQLRRLHIASRYEPAPKEKRYPAAPDSAKPRMTLRVIADFFWLRHAGCAGFTSLRDMSLRRRKSAIRLRRTRQSRG